MNDLQQIKKKLIDENKVESLLEALGCSYTNIEQQGLLITAQLPDRFYSNNKRAVQVKMNKFMSCAIRSKSDFSGDIFNLISYINHDMRGEELQNDLSNAKEFICDLFGWKQFLERKKGSIVAVDYTASLKEIINGKRRRREVKPNPVLSETILDEFLSYPSLSWIEEGISYKTQKMYGIGFDLESKRITIPMRNRFGKLIGVKARIMKDEDDDRKYLYLYRFNNGQELFNFHYAHPYILIEKKVYIFEGEKSCMKMYEHGIYNCVAIGSSNVTDVQAEIIKQCGLDIEVILCLDSDKTPEEVKEVAKEFKGRKVYGMMDLDNLLGEKASPIDKGVDTFKKLEEEYCFQIK